MFLRSNSHSRQLVLLNAASALLTLFDRNSSVDERRISETFPKNAHAKLPHAFAPRLSIDRSQRMKRYLAIMHSKLKE